MQFSVLLKSKVLLIGDARVLLGMQTDPLTKKKKLVLKLVSNELEIYSDAVFISLYLY